MKSRVDTPISLPVVTICLKPKPPSFDDRFMTEKPKPPDCDTMLTGPGSYSKANTEPNPPNTLSAILIMPWQFGPTTPMSLSRAIRASSRWRSIPPPPTSENPELKMMTYGTPLAPHCSSISTTRDALMRISTRSGVSGTSASDG
jgi:hypothetical protein